MRTEPRARRARGFTLVELLIVVAIIAIAVGLAARIFSRGLRGEAAPAFARTLLVAVQDARHTAVSLGRTASMTLDGTNSKIVTTVYDPTIPAWGSSVTMNLPHKMQLCVPAASAVPSTTSTCPLSGAQTVCFYPNGRVSLLTSGACATTSPTTGSGASIYLDMNSGEKHYRILVWGLTGMSKLIDTW